MISGTHRGNVAHGNLHVLSYLLLSLFRGPGPGCLVHAQDHPQEMVSGLGLGSTSTGATRAMGVGAKGPETTLSHGSQEPLLQVANQLSAQCTTKYDSS